MPSSCRAGLAQLIILLESFLFLQQLVSFSIAYALNYLLLLESLHF